MKNISDAEEEKRVSILDSYDLIGTSPEPELDTITELAARVSGAEVASLSFFGSREMFYKSVFGTDLQDFEYSSPPRLLLSKKPDKPTVIPDLRSLNGGAHQVQIPENTAYRFFTGFPVVSPDGLHMGALAVFDAQPHRLSSEQLRSLSLLAKQVTSLLEGRKKQKVIQQSYRLQREMEQKSAREKLNNEALINTTSDDIWSIDQNYRFITFNEAFSKKIKALIGAEIRPGMPALFPGSIPDDLHRQFKNFFDRALSGEAFVEEYCRPDKLVSGMVIWIELNAHPIVVEGKITGAAFFAKTVTERKTAELKLRESEANYRMLFDNSPLPKILVDIDSLEILEINRSALEKFGYRKEELLGSKWGMLMQEEEIGFFYDAIQRLKGSKKESKLSHIVQKKQNGELILGDLMVHELVYEGRDSILAVLNDRTEELKSLSVKSEMANIMENSLNEIYIFDTQNLHFSYANRGALRNMGYTLEELKRLTPYAIKPEFDERRFRSFLTPLLLDEREKLTFVTVHQRKNGTRYPVEVHLQKMRYEGRSAFVAIIIDITAAKEAEAKLQELNTLLEKSNRELEQFASITAHDLQEPLRMVSAFTSLLERKYGSQLDEKGRQYIHFAVDGSVRMQRMIQDILEYSRAGMGKKKMESFQSAAVLRDVLDDLQKRIEQSDASVELPAQDVELFGHANDIYRLFLNLINNALKFVPQERRPRVQVKLRQDARYFHFTVEDNGIGIKPENLHLLFNPFKRLHSKKTYEGTGLGLATCKKIVNQFGGDIWVTSQPGEGSQFHFTLPKNPIS
ncbi:PAS domain S-box-containing protein [Cyclobacterium lianum]|uniref:histidine kinase n=1 Tax=Cyclobacterium lianum TaxID=388280 RepID=A0A1M7I2W2_9BACT|nr:PAS domain S-box protein [Cyclobacterium lianum]SHM35050.1 PAS domain S-box-containing protein [Cyclobacterium lianum]